MMKLCLQGRLVLLLVILLLLGLRLSVKKKLVLLVVGVRLLKVVPHVLVLALFGPLLPFGFFKWNFDGSKLSNNNASLGFVIGDSNGDAILVGGRPLSCA